MGIRDRAQHRHVESFFVAEVVIHRGDVGAGLLTYLSYRSSAITDFGKNLARRFEQTTLCS